jgi:hypothetical protein
MRTMCHISRYRAGSPHLRPATRHVIRAGIPASDLKAYSLTSLEFIHILLAVCPSATDRWGAGRVEATLDKAPCVPMANGRRVAASWDRVGQNDTNRISEGRAPPLHGTGPPHRPPLPHIATGTQKSSQSPLVGTESSSHRAPVTGNSFDAVPGRWKPRPDAHEQSIQIFRMCPG